MKTKKLLVIVASVCLMAFFNVSSFAQNAPGQSDDVQPNIRLYLKGMLQAEGEDDSQCLTIIGALVDFLQNQQDTIDQCEAQLAECEGKLQNFAPVPRTGKDQGNPGWDGWTRRGVEWPEPRFTDNVDGTVTDNLTGLIWLQDATCLKPQIWGEVLNTVDALADGQCGLTDGSEPGDWSVPNIREFESLTHFDRWCPAIPLINPFVPFSSKNWCNIWSDGRKPVLYMTSTTSPCTTGFADCQFPHEDYEGATAFAVDIVSGIRRIITKSDTLLQIWPIRVN
jgi:hypothetical protein